MSARRRAALVAVVALLGIALAAAVTYGTSRLVSQKIGLSSEPLSAGANLLPRSLRERPSTGGGARRATTTQTRTATAPAAPASTQPETPSAPAPAPAQTEAPTVPRTGSEAPAPSAAAPAGSEASARGGGDHADQRARSGGSSGDD